MSHYVYILEDDTRPHWCKVGISKDCEKRVNGMRTAAPSLSLFASFELADEKLARRVEKTTHETLKEYYGKQREWFQCAPRCAQYVLEGIIEELEVNDDRTET